MGDERPLTIERVTSVDETLAAGLGELFDEGMEWDPEQGRRFLENPDALLLVARWGGDAAGFTTPYRLPRVDRPRAEVQLYEIGVDDRFRRRGVATALIGEVHRWAAEVGADEVWVLTETENAAARALYAATGGEEDASRFVMFTYGVGQR